MCRSFGRRAIRELFGDVVLEFLDDESCPCITREFWVHLNLGESLHDTTDYDASGQNVNFEWIIQSIRLADGTREGEIKGRFYATDARDGKVYEIDLYTYQFAGMFNRKTKFVFRGGKIRVLQGIETTRIAQIMAIYKLCLRHPGKEIEVNNGKSGGDNSEYLPGYHLDWLPVPCSNFDNECMRASAAICFTLLGLSKKAKKFVRAQQNIIRERVKAGELPRIRDHHDLAKEIRKFGLQKKYMTDEEGTVLLDDVRFENFETTPTRGVFIVTLVSDMGCKHDVVIDNRSNPVVMYDCNEPFAVPLSLITLQGCSPSGKFKCITDVMQVYIQSDLGKHARADDKFKTTWH